MNTKNINLDKPPVSLLSILSKAAEDRFWYFTGDTIERLGATSEGEDLPAMEGYEEGDEEGEPTELSLADLGFDKVACTNGINEIIELGRDWYYARDEDMVFWTTDLRATVISWNYDVDDAAYAVEWGFEPTLNEAAPEYEGEVTVWCKGHYCNENRQGWLKTEEVAEDCQGAEYGERHVFSSYAEAKAWIEDEEKSETYHFANNEYARPDYTICEA